jgi:hypothetical protein
MTGDFLILGAWPEDSRKEAEFAAILRKAVGSHWQLQTVYQLFWRAKLSRP